MDFDVILNWLSRGLFDFSWWQVLLVALVTTHITIVSVTVFLHRHQAHRSLELHPVVSHFFRFWLFFFTGMVTKEWVAIHRKHHAHCETPEDPHSPQVFGLKKLLREGAELYRTEAKKEATMKLYGQGTPNDWLEKNVYSKLHSRGVFLLLAIEVILFGGLGLTVWAIQMGWIPFFAAGIVNGVGHHSGYRNFEVQDASTNISPVGILIGGEELHNNHHAFPASAKLSAKWFEFDIGWMYIRILSMMGLAKVRFAQFAPKFSSQPRLQFDASSAQGLLQYKIHLFSEYARILKDCAKTEFEKVRAAGYGFSVKKDKFLKQVVVENSDQNAEVAAVVEHSSSLALMLKMRGDLYSLWKSNANLEVFRTSLQQWCERAEKSGVSELSFFATRLRSVRV
jgi:stearoyl-CoA desaturase (delta-9 desaturase)